MVNLMAKNPFTTESVEFDTPANRIIQQLQPKNQFRINTSLPDIAFLRQLSVQGRLRYFRGSGVSAITITPTVGETLFIYKVILSNSNTTLGTTFTIQNNGITRYVILINSLTSIQTDMFDSLVGDGTKTFTAVANRAEGGVTMFGWVENTSRIRDVAT